MKIGIDIHGTADAFPDFFRELSRLFIEAGHEVHIVTGVVLKKAIEELKILNIDYTIIFSVITYHETKGTKITYADKENPWMSEDDWRRTKADYAERVGLDIMIDDSASYGRFFKTPYMKVRNPNEHTA